MKTQSYRGEKGQILVLLAVGFIVLLAFVALAIDGGAIFLDRRSAQNAADAAALAGGYEVARNPWVISTQTVPTIVPTVRAASQARASDNHYGTDSGKTVVIDYPANNCAIHYVAGDTDNTHYVCVTITSTVNTSFLHFIFAGPVQNTVTSIAHVNVPDWSGAYNGTGLVALAPHSCGRMTVGGNVVANLVGGGIFVNSDNADCAADGGSGSMLVYTPSMTVVGDLSSQLSRQVGTGLIINPGTLQSPAASAALAYPPKVPARPTCPSAAQKIHTNVTVPGITGVRFDEYSPGSMNGFPSGNILFDPGIYCITINRNGNAGSINNGQYLFNYDPSDPNGPNPNPGVLLYITGTDPCNLTVNGGATLKLHSYQLDPWKGLLFFFNPNSWSPVSTGSGEGPLILNGTSQSYIIGTVLAPTCSIKMNGTGGNFYQGQVIGYDATLLGGAAINMTYVESDNLEMPGPSKVDLNQ